MTGLLDELPAHLGERTRWHPNSKTTVPSKSGRLVLYGMQTAMRWDENPALDVACHWARQLGLPLLVYQGLSSRMTYASDRHHTFILQGARDLQQAADQRGLSYALYVERDRAKAPLADLVHQAAIVIVEDMPTDPHRQYVRAALRNSACPFVAVDTACVAPMQLVGRSYERAFEYRDRTRGLYKARLKRPWPVVESLPEPYPLAELDWLVSIQLNETLIAELVAQCDIDHTIAPVAETCGGMVAGLQRWENFKARKLRRYADDRNDPLKEPSSRLSAYLHYGMVSPLQIAREAAMLGGTGAEKFLDELLIWRELAYAFCCFRPDHNLWSAIPKWAQETLAEHQSDRRRHLYSWESLARAATHDRFWNAAQRSLLIDGELHNNVRMTWGKALLNWCAQPREALRLMIDLNHRYALDGRDPASYGGLLWCLGQFDRPFSPSQPVFGTVRTRPTQDHVKRLDVVAYEQLVSRSAASRQRRIAVVGAGLSGLFAARTLRDLGHQVTVFEKSRGPAGRMSTRRTTHADFDHGAQYFTCRDRRFRRYVDSWLARSLVARWESPIAIYTGGSLQGQSTAERFVAVPTMNELGKYLAHDVDVQYEVRIASLQRKSNAWSLSDDREGVRGEFDQVIVAVPAPQAAELLREASPELSIQLGQQEYAPCWCVLMNLEQALPVNWGGAFINTGPIRWVARNQTKPGRQAQPESLVLHAQGAWSQTHLEADPAQVVDQLVTVLGAELGIELSAITYSAAHRWLYAMPVNDQPLSMRALVSDDQSLIACGDWASGSRIEGAFLSGAAAAGIVTRRAKA